MISANINYINRSGHSVEFEGGKEKKTIEEWRFNEKKESLSENII